METRDRAAHDDDAQERPDRRVDHRSAAAVVGRGGGADALYVEGQAAAGGGDEVQIPVPQRIENQAARRGQPPGARETQILANVVIAGTLFAGAKQAGETGAESGVVGRTVHALGPGITQLRLETAAHPPAILQLSAVVTGRRSVAQQPQHVIGCGEGWLNRRAHQPVAPRAHGADAYDVARAEALLPGSVPLQDHGRLQSRIAGGDLSIRAHGGQNRRSQLCRRERERHRGVGQHVGVGRRIEGAVDGAVTKVVEQPDPHAQHHLVPRSVVGKVGNPDARGQVEPARGIQRTVLGYAGNVGVRKGERFRSRARGGSGIHVPAHSVRDGGAIRGPPGILGVEREVGVSRIHGSHIGDDLAIQRQASQKRVVAVNQAIEGRAQAVRGPVVGLQQLAVVGAGLQTVIAGNLGQAIDHVHLRLVVAGAAPEGIAGITQNAQVEGTGGAGDALWKHQRILQRHGAAEVIHGGLPAVRGSRVIQPQIVEGAAGE